MFDTIKTIYVNNQPLEAIYYKGNKLWEKYKGEPCIRIADGVNALNLAGTNSVYIPLIKDDSANTSIRLELDMYLENDLFTDISGANARLCVCGAMESSWHHGCVIAINPYDSTNYKLQSFYWDGDNLVSVEHLTPGRQTISITPTGERPLTHIKGTIYLFSLYDYRNNCPHNYPYQAWQTTYPSAQYLGNTSTQYPLSPLFKIFSLKIYGDNDTLLHEYKPTIVNGHKGMYDEVTQTFGACNNDDYFTIDY